MSPLLRLLRALGRGFRWEKGRRGTGYRKLLLAQGRSWDAYLIDYPPGSGTDEHRDPVPGKRHFRANLVLLGSWGSFEGRSTFRIGPLVVFRPDRELHRVRRVSRRRIVLSFGWVLARGEGEQ